MKLERSIERWSLCSPEAIAKGSEAQVMFCIKDAQHDIAALAAENERLRTALKPFADECGTWFDDVPSDYRIKIKLLTKVITSKMTVHDLRRARDVLADRLVPTGTQQETSFSSCSEDGHSCSDGAPPYDFQRGR